MDAYLKQLEQWLFSTGADFLLRVFVSLIMLLVGSVIIRGVTTAVRAALDRSARLRKLLKSFILTSTSRVLWLLLWLMVLDRLGVQVGPIIAGLGVAGFILGFAFQDTLSNFAAGLMLLANNPFEAGDYIEAAGHGGVVHEVNLMATTLNTPDNRRVMIPNKSVWGAPIVNFSATGTRRIELVVGVSYDADIERAREVIAQVVRADERVLAAPAPVVAVRALAGSSVEIVIRPWTKTADTGAATSDLLEKIKEALDASGIEIPFPQMVVHQAPAKDRAGA